MRRLTLLLSLLALPLAHARADFASPLAQPGLQCRSAIALTERGSRIPEHLLAAIGRVESGRRDPQSGTWNPWPWTINAEGQGFFYETKAQAIAAVRALQARGVRSIDVAACRSTSCTIRRPSRRSNRPSIRAPMPSMPPSS